MAMQFERTLTLPSKIAAYVQSKGTDGKNYLSDPKLVNQALLPVMLKLVKAQINALILVYRKSFRKFCMLKAKDLLRFTLIYWLV